MNVSVSAAPSTVASAERDRSYTMAATSAISAAKAAALIQAAQRRTLTPTRSAAASSVG